MTDTVTPNNMPGAQAAQQTADATTDAGAATTPPWGTDPAKYDPDTAARLIANLRDSEDKQGKTIKSQTARITELESQLAQAKPLLDAHNEQQRREQGELVTMRQDMDALQQQLTAAQQTAQDNLAAALRSKAGELASNRDPNRPGSAFANPGVATRLIDLSECLTAEGQIDDAAIASKLDALAQSEPYLLAQAGNTARKPNPAQGHGSGSIPTAEAQQQAEKNGDVKGAMRAAATQLVELTRKPQY